MVSPAQHFQPPLPDEPEPEPEPGTGTGTERVAVAGVKRPAAAVVSDEDEDATTTRTRRGDKGKARRTEEVGDDDDDDDDEEWDPAATSGKEVQGRRVEEKDTSAPVPVPVTTTTTGTTDTGGWQAVWAPAQNAYYFWNAQTGAVQWENPLVPPTADSTTTTAPPLPDEPAPSANAWDASAPTPAPGSTLAESLPPIDPGLAHLLPASQRPGGSGTPTAAAAADAHLYQTAQFNARTGRFTANDYAFTVDHLAEANRARRQEEAFFDVAAWEREKEREVQQRREAEARGDAPRKLTKKDMDRFRAKKQERKMRNHAWLKG